ncbi:MAG: HIT domain-containing protein [Bacteriovoracaceae bacterium]|nr:HIT domain-containing protein [Bacteriovoracaceae bacterium]
MEHCLFCRIVKNEIPSGKVLETEKVLAFHDLHPQAPIHILFIHKNHHANINETVTQSAQDILDILNAITNYTQAQSLDKSGFRIVVNTGRDAGQTIFHTHFHLLAGKTLGRFGI